MDLGLGTFLVLRCTEDPSNTEARTKLAHSGRGTVNVGKTFARLTGNPMENGNVGGQKDEDTAPPHCQAPWDSAPGAGNKTEGSHELRA